MRLLILSPNSAGWLESRLGSFKPNAFGLYDVHGNVDQWCSDWYGKNYYLANGNERDPQGPSGGNERVLRGGDWSGLPVHCRSARRFKSEPVSLYGNLFGFRVVVLPG